jgi:hypothetical protein
MNPDPAGLPGTAVVRARRGRGLAVFVLVGAVIGAALLGLTAYRALDAVRVVSLDPLGSSMGWLLAFGAVAVVAVAVVVLAVAAVLYCRPRGVAALGLAASLVLPAAAVALAGTLGVAVAKQHAVADLTADGGLVDSAADVAQSWNVDVGPFRGLLKGLVDAAG